MTTPSPDLNIPIYDNDPEAVYRGISRRKSRLKLVLKTKNDPIFLRDWLEHHGRIVGYENLVVADNLSDDKSVIETYEQFRGQVFTFRFSGFHNRLHREAAFPAVYRALYESSDFFQIIDTDERLVALHDNHVVSDRNFIDMITDDFRHKPILGTFFNNKRGRKDTFVVNENHMLGPLWAGKSMFPSCIRMSFSKDESVNHNFEIPDVERVLGGVQRTRLGVLHLTTANFTQRMRANREKLVARKLVEPDTPFADIAQLQSDHRYIKHLVNQIREGLKQLEEPQNVGPCRLGKHDMRIDPDGTLAFGSENARLCYLRIVNEPAKMLFSPEGKAFLQQRLRVSSARRAAAATRAAV